MTPCTAEFAVATLDVVGLAEFINIIQIVDRITREPGAEVMMIVQTLGVA